MQLKAENRHQTVHEFMDDIRNVKPSVLVDETIGGSPQQPTSKRTWYIISALGCFVALLIGYFLRGRSGSEPVEENKPQEIKTYSFISIYDYPMVKVDGGTFIMGSNQTDEDDCLPHTVTLSDFYIGQFEVSQGFWTKIMNENPSEYQDVDDINKFPVENVSFEEVQVFINRLNNKTGKSFSLPTEAQWEFAARGGTQSKGTNFAGSQYPNNIWFDKNNPVMLKFPPSVNELGIYQMSGNVAEWCLDYYNRMFYSQSNKSKNPLNTKANNSRVVRGGSFDDTDPEYVTVYYRNSSNDAAGYIGFRLVVNL